MQRSVLVVDDEESICKSLEGVLSDEGFSVMIAKSGEEALAMMDEKLPDLVLLDIWLPGIDGIEVLRRMRETLPDIPVIIMSGHGTIETAVKATKLGAYDFIEKPLSIEKILITLDNAFNYRMLREENKLLRQKIRYPDLTGRSPAMMRLREQISKLAPTDSCVLIMGENGTGKEVVARYIHKKSKRASRPFIELNCAAIPDSLIESELFGYEKGAFTGADHSKRGKFDEAHMGTLFLDEIGDMSLNAQAKILRILQEQTFNRVGGSKTIHVDVRIIAATNKDLQEEINKGRFRKDLYFRLLVIPIVVPPLRERKEDIPLLVEEFLRDFSVALGTEKKEISPQALSLLMRHDWPGNVRELKNIIERLVIMSAGPVIKESDILFHLNLAESQQSEKASDLFLIPRLREARTEFEKRYILRKLSEFNNNITQTAQAMGIERSHLHRKIKSLGLLRKDITSEGVEDID